MSEQAQRNLIAALYLLLVWSRRIIVPVIIFYVVFWMGHSYWFLLLLLFGMGGNSAKMAKRLMVTDPWPIKPKKEKKAEASANA